MYFGIFISKLDFIFHRTIQVGRDPRRSLVQCPAQSRVSCGITPGCSGLFINSWKRARTDTSQRQRHHNLSGQWWKCFPLYPVWIPFSIFAWCLLSSRHAPLWRVWVHLLGDLLTCTGGPPGPSSPPRAASSPRLNKPLFSILSSQGKCSLRGNPWLQWWPFDELIPVWDTERSLGRKYPQQIFCFQRKKKMSKCFCFVLSLKYAYFSF